MLYATIMAGGAGTRFWPASRQMRPKQLLSLLGQRSMLQATVDRLVGLCESNQILILTNDKLVEASRQQLPDVPAESFIGEPCKRDTAPCIAMAARLIANRDDDATMLVMPADHVIRSIEQFHVAVNQAAELLDQDKTRIVTFGIPPSYPAQVFGYIQRGEMIGSIGHRVERFREKPDLATAQQFLDDGGYYWNSGIFMWRAETILQALNRFEPQMTAHIDIIGQAAGTPQFDEVLSREFSAIKGKSIDYAVMEHYENVCVIEAPFDWDDLGNWTAVPRLSGIDEQGNSITGKHLGVDSRGCIVYGSNAHLVVTLGMRDCIVVHTPDATLIADKNDEAAVKQVVDKINQLGWTEYL